MSEIKANPETKLFCTLCKSCVITQAYRNVHVLVGNDQEKAQSERNSKNRGGKKLN